MGSTGSQAGGGGLGSLQFMLVALYNYNADGFRVENKMLLESFLKQPQTAQRVLSEKSEKLKVLVLQYVLHQHIFERFFRRLPTGMPRQMPG